MKQLKILLYCVILCSCFLTGHFVSAADDLRVELTPPETVKANKAFDIYVDYYCSKGISTMLSKFEYDEEMLEFRSAKLMDLIDDRFFYSKAFSGKLGVSYSNNKKTVDKLTVCLRFSPLKEAEEYTVKIIDCQACYDETDLLVADKLPSCTVRIKQEGGVMDKTSKSSSGTSSVSSSDSSSKTSIKLSSQKSSGSESDKSELSSISDEAGRSEEGQNGVYYIKSEEKNIDNGQTIALAVVGLAVVFVAAVIVAFRAGVRRNQKSK